MSPFTCLKTDATGKSADEKTYRGMIDSLLYFIANRPDVMFSVCKCARFQSTPKESHLTAVKLIIRYLIGSSDLGLYPFSNNFDLLDIQMLILQVIKMIEKLLVKHVNF